MKLSPVLALTAAVLAMFASAQAATIVWSAATNITGDTDVSLTGSGVYAYNFGTAAVSPTVNGVTFTGIASSVSNVSTTMVNANGTAFTSAATPYSALSSSYQSLLTSGNFIDDALGSPTTRTLTLNNLTSGSTYQVQIWVSDPRGIASKDRQEILSDGSGNNVTLKYSASASAGSAGQFVTGTFTATGTSQTISFAPTAPNGVTTSAQINALQLRQIAVPEPTSAVLGAASLGLLALRRKRA